MADAKFRISRNGSELGWLVNGVPQLSFGWRRGDALCDAIRRATEADDGAINTEGNVQFRNEIGKVLVVIDGRLRLALEKHELRNIGEATRSQCRKAEEETAADRIARDGAILLRHGAPFGLTDNPTIRDMVHREAATNRKLRLALPGIRDTVQMNVPVIRKVNRTNLERYRLWKTQLQQHNKPH